MTYLQLREQLVLSVVLSAKNRIVNSRGIQGGKPNPAVLSISQTYRTLGGKGEEKEMQCVLRKHKSSYSCEA
jgi:hypothetical protein